MVVKLPKPPEEEELLQVEEEDDLILPGIEALEQTTLETTTEIETVISPDVLTAPPVVIEDTFFTAEEAAQFGADLPLDWQLKITPEGVVSIIDPAGWQFLEGDFFISPEGQPLTLAQVEALYDIPEEQRILEFPTLPQVFEVLPEVPVTDRITELEAQLAEEMPGAERGRLEQQLESLKAQEALGVVFPEQDIADIAEFYFPEVEDIELVPPAERVRVEEQQALATERLDEFIAEIVKAGRTPETEAILQTLFPGISPKDLDVIFFEETVIEESLWKDVWDAFYLSASKVVSQFGQYFTSALPNFLFPDEPFEEEIRKEAERQGLTVTQIDLLIEEKSRANKAKRDWFRQINAEQQATFEDWILAHPELKQEGKPNWLETIASALPFSLAILGTVVATFALTKNPFTAIAAGTALATPSQSQDLYEDLLASGAPEDKAAEIAVPIGVLIASIEAVTDIPLLKAIFPGLGILRPAIQKAVVKATMAQLIKKGIKTFTVIEIVEAMEEVAQGAIHNAFVKIYDEDREVFDRIDETIINTLIATLPFAIFGLGMSMRPVSPDVAITVSQEVKTAEGWVLNEQTGTWFKPVPMTETYDEALKEAQEAGISERDGKKAALNEVAKAPEGEVAIRKAADKAREELPPVEVTPVEEVVPTPLPTPPTTEVFQARLQAELVPEIRVEVPEGYKINEVAGVFDIYRPDGELIGTRPTREAAIKYVQSYEQEFKLAKPPPVEVVPEVTPLQAVQRRAMEVEAEIEGMQETIRGSRLKRLLPVWKRIQRREDRVTDLTIKEYKDLTGKDVVPPGSLTKDKKHVYWRDALDSVVSEFGYENTQDLLVDLEKLGKMDEQLKKLQIEREQVKEELAGFRLEPTAEEIETNLTTPGEPKLTLAQIDFALEAFGRYITEPSGLSAWELTQRLRSKTRAERANELKVRVQELIIEQGITPEAAIDQAIKDTMSGKLPVVTTDYLSDLTQEMRDVLFNKVYHTLKAEPFEMMSTTEALTNALLGKAIPRIPGVKGMSAFTRLERVFGDQPQVFEALQKGAREGKSLEDIVEGVFRVPGQPPTPLDPVMVDYLRVVGKEIKTAEDLAIIDVYYKEHPAPTLPPVKPPVVKGMEQMPMIPDPQKHIIIRALKEVGATIVDIGSFMRANMASFDFSFWRQQSPLILNNKRAFIQANIYAWNSMFSQQAVEASWIRITRDPLYQLYEEADLDFLRPPPDIQTGIEHWKGIEEFGFVHGVDRPIPKFTARLIWVKLSARTFATGTNEHNWRIFKQHYKDMLKVQERIASGEVKLKPGEAFSMIKELKDYGKMLMDFTGRASLGKLGPAAPAAAALFFSPRLNLGRALTGRHLISSNPHVRKAAWLSLTTFVGGVGGIILLGWQYGLWEVEWDPRSPNFAQIRIGNVRIDPWGGFRPHVVFLARVLTKTGLSGATGAEYVVDPLGATAWFVRSKAAPLAAIMADFLVGKTFLGEEVDIKNPQQWIERVAPFAARDLFEVYMRDPLLALFTSIPALLGAGITTYSGEWDENFPKLGLPKYPENLPYGITEPVYDVKDFYADTAARFKGVDPETLTELKGFPPYLKALVEAARIKEDLALMANQSLISINADLVEGTTFIQYYQMWLEREKIVATGDEDALKAFDQDERTRNAHLGNMTQQQYALLVEYHSIINETEKAEFLERYPELEINPRDEWLRDNPKENALLAVWGQADILTIEAYDEFLTLADEFNIPNNALAELTLPPRESLETHFSYLEIGKEFGWNSWETQLLLAKDPAYSEWRGLEPIDTPVEALELKVKHRALSDTLNSYNDKESPNYIEDKDERETARDKLKDDNPEWVDDTRRIEAIENNASDETIEEWVGRGQTIDKFGAGSSEAMVWLLDHPETFQWALDQGLLEDNGKDWNAPVLRINVEWATWDEWYDAITGITVEGIEYSAAQVREQALEMYPDYALARRKRDAYRLEVPEEFIDTWVEYYSLPLGKARTDFLREHPEYYEVVWLGIQNNKPI